MLAAKESDEGGLLMVDPKFADQAKQMKHLCKVCEEPAAGFHFGAFTCEGCKSFFGRCAESAENPRVALPACKNGAACSVLGRARTNCKQCRYDKCKRVGMSRERSRFGRRSHYFKVHELIKANEQLPPQPPTTMTMDFGVPVHKPLAVLAPPLCLWDSAALLCHLAGGPARLASLLLTPPPEPAAIQTTLKRAAEPTSEDEPLDLTKKRRPEPLDLSARK